jgi:hypothetical protein
MSRPGVRVREVDSTTVQLVAEMGAGEVAFHVELPTRGRLAVTVYTRHGFGDAWVASDELARTAAPMVRERVAFGPVRRIDLVDALADALLDLARLGTN